MAEEKRIGALYIRVSTDRQEELSPDAQIRLGREYAAQHNIHIPDEYIFRDDGISGKKADRRPGFKALIATARLKGHPIDCILVWKFSRFARNQEESIVYKSMLARDKVEVISISEPLPDGPFGALNERIIEWMDEYYLTNLSTEVVRGMTENAMRGNYQTSPPIGYRFVAPKRPPEKDSETCPVIEYINKWFMQDCVSLRQISVRLNSMGYRTKRGNLFDPRGIVYILRNPFYAGKIRWNYTERGRKLKPAEDVILVDGRHEPYYDWEHYLAIQAHLDEILAKSPTQKRRTRDVSACMHWLSGLLVCSACGKTLAYSGPANQKGFQCWNYAKGMCFESHFISISSAEQYVIHGLEQMLTADSISYIVIHKSEESSDKKDELSRILFRLTERERRAKDAYLDGIDSIEEYKETRALIQSERFRVQDELDSLFASDSSASSEDDQRMLQNVSDVLSVLKNPDADYEEKGRAIRSIVDHIVFDRKNTSFDFQLKLVK